MFRFFYTYSINNNRKQSYNSYPSQLHSNKMSTLLFTHFLKVIGEKLGIEDTLHGSYEKNPIYLGNN